MAITPLFLLQPSTIFPSLPIQRTHRMETHSISHEVAWRKPLSCANHSGNRGWSHSRIWVTCWCVCACLGCLLLSRRWMGGEARRWRSLRMDQLSTCGQSTQIESAHTSWSLGLVTLFTHGSIGVQRPNGIIFSVAISCNCCIIWFQNYLRNC